MKQVAALFFCRSRYLLQIAVYLTTSQKHCNYKMKKKKEVQGARGKGQGSRF
jgi:hypothetical protein